MTGSRSQGEGAGQRQPALACLPRRPDPTTFRGKGTAALTTVPPQLERLAGELVATARTVGGHLTAREVKFLALLAACPTADGEILEIGTFKGKSTIVLARAARLTGTAKVVAVDPFVLGSDAPDAALAHLRGNLQKHGVAEHVEFHQDHAAGLAHGWNRRIRLLWIDGDHTYEGAKSDFALFSPFLPDGGILAMHDVLNVMEGPIRVFMEQVLLSQHFGPVGLCGSIGWAQFCADETLARRYRDHKMGLHQRLGRLLPYVAFGRKAKGQKRRYKLQRWRVPHGEVDPAQWLQGVRVVAGAKDGPS